ncbi:hypothetical protein Efla_002412 [Eimeria flavescens]
MWGLGAPKTLLRGCARSSRGPLGGPSGLPSQRLSTQRRGPRKEGPQGCPLRRPLCQARRTLGPRGSGTPQAAARGAAGGVYAWLEGPGVSLGGPPPRASGGFLKRAVRGYFSLPSELKLKDVVKLPLLQRLSRERIKEVWMSHLLSQPHLHAETLNRVQYEVLTVNARHTPMFVVPLPRGAGAFEMLVAQFQRNCCLLTSLEQYKKNPLSASPLFLLIAYGELAASHDLALLKGDSLSAAVGPREAQHLTRVLLQSYLDPSRYEWVKAFNLTPEAFDFAAFKERNADFFVFPLPDRPPQTPHTTPASDLERLWVP